MSTTIDEQLSPTAAAGRLSLGWSTATDWQTKRQDPDSETHAAARPAKHEHQPPRSDAESRKRACLFNPTRSPARLVTLLPPDTHRQASTNLAVEDRREMGHETKHEQPPAGDIDRSRLGIDQLSTVAAKAYSPSAPRLQ